MSPQVTTGRQLRIGLVASRLHRTGPAGALFRLLRPLEEAIRDELQPTLQVVGQTYDALAEAGVLQGYAGMHRLPARREGGLIHLVADSPLLATLAGLGLLLLCWPLIGAGLRRLVPSRRPADALEEQGER